MSETLALLIGLTISVSAGAIAGATVTIILYELRSGNTWRRLRHHYRPLLWNFGLDWSEIKRTYKRVFMFYYLRRLPASSRFTPSSESSDDDVLDESGDISPGSYPPMSETTEPPSYSTYSND